RAMRFRRHRWLRRAAWAAAAALLLPLLWTFPHFSIWRLQPAEYRFHQPPPRPWRWARPFFAPREDPMETGSVWHQDEWLRKLHEELALDPEEETP
ncbi:MAG: hypothetical protein IK066_07915, partial [Kiritimatiellae bacterium]|nr:hypothetical protein [Kiritimatiellia bacterium]